MLKSLRYFIADWVCPFIFVVLVTIGLGVGLHACAQQIIILN